MTYNILAAMKTYASYHEAVGFYFDKQDLINEISTMDVQNLLLTIAMLNNPTSINSELIRNDFTESFASKHPKRSIKEILSRNDVLFHPQGLLNVAKWLIAYGDFSKSEPAFSQRDNIHLYVQQTIELCMIVSDYTDQRTEGDESIELLQADLLRNANFNSKTDIASMVARTLYLLDELSTISENFGYNYKEKFAEKFNYSLVEYIGLIFSIYSIYLSNNKNITPHNIDTFFKDTIIPEKGRAFFDLLVCKPSEIKEWAIKSIDNAWDFRRFYANPLILLPCGRIHPISPRILVESLYTDLEIKIYNLYRSSGHADDVKAKLGLQFEKYVCDLASETFDNSKYVTKVIPEFSYGSNKSPDFMVLFGYKLLVIEVKSYRPTADFAFHDDPVHVKNGVDKIIVKPLNQTLERLGELMDRGKWNNEDRPIVSEVYIMTVTLVGITTMDSNEKYVRSSLRVPTNVPLAGFFHVNIHEFELLCELATRKHAKPLINYLKRNTPQRLPFSSFLSKETLHPRRPRRMKIIYEDKMELIRKTLFGDSGNTFSFKK